VLLRTAGEGAGKPNAPATQVTVVQAPDQKGKAPEVIANAKPAAPATVPTNAVQPVPLSKKHHRECLRVQGTAEGQSLAILIDSGSGVNLISDHCLQEVAGQRIKLDPAAVSVQVTQADGGKLITLGKVNVHVTIGTARFTQACIVVHNLQERLLLGMDTILDTGMVIDGKNHTITVGESTVPFILESNSIHSVQVFSVYSRPLTEQAASDRAHKAQLEQLLKDFRDVLAETEDEVLHPSKVKIEHVVDTTTTAPAAVPPHRYRDEEKVFIEKFVTKMLDHGLIRPSHSGNAAPIVLVRRLEYDPSHAPAEPRVTVDNRKRNAQTAPDAYPMPRIDDLLTALVGAKIFSKMDLAKGF
jgi:hypothetical protein